MIITKEKLEGLVGQGLVTAKTDDARGFITYKYKNKVFYKNLWGTDPLLLEARGVVFASNGDIVQRPLKKSFNVYENDTELQNEYEYNVVRKVNGFMAAATVYEGELVVSTTGTTTSDFAKLAERYVAPIKDCLCEQYTYIFEVCDKSDPHIVEEKEGLYLLAIRNKVTGSLLSQTRTRDFADDNGILYPDLTVKKGNDILREIKEVRHEGFAIYDPITQEMVAKIKSPYYLSKKAMMRMGTNKANWMFDNPDSFRMKMLCEEFYKIQDYILEEFTKEQWLGYTEQDRRKIIEEYFYA